MPLVLALIGLLLVQPQPGTRLSDQQIDQVIAYARTGEGLGGVRCYASAAPGDQSESNAGFAVMLTGPGGRIFDAVKAAQAKGLTFTRAQVTAEMAAMTLVVVAYPEATTQDSSGSHDAPHPIGVIIRTVGPQRIVIAPRSTEQVRGAMPTSGPGVRAVFAYQDFARIHLGDVEVVVLAGQAERVCTIDSTARASIR